MAKKKTSRKLQFTSGLIVPENMDDLPKLRANSRFVAPTVVNSMGLCTVVEDQGATSKCAAYAVTSFAETILWKRNNFPTQLDYDKVYAEAKKIDGSPNEDGTTLPAAFEGLLKVYPDIFKGEGRCKLIHAYGGNMEDIKYALHRYGCMVGGFNITEDWFNCDRSCKGWIPSTKGAKVVGGHAVLVCGYNDKGLQILNSWGETFGEYGFATLRWSDAKVQFGYGAVWQGCMRHIDD